MLLPACSWLPPLLIMINKVLASLVFLTPDLVSLSLLRGTFLTYKFDYSIFLYIKYFSSISLSAKQHGNTLECYSVLAAWPLPDSRAPVSVRLSVTMGLFHMCAVLDSHTWLLSTLHIASANEVLHSNFFFILTCLPY